MSGRQQRGSLQRKITASTTIAVSVVIATSGFLVHRAVERRLVAASQDSLEAMLRLGHVRAASAARNTARRGEAQLPDFGGEDSGDHEWLIRDPDSGAILAGTLEFPGVDLLPLQADPDGVSDVVFREVIPESGVPWRVAGFVCRPADSLPGDQRGDPRGDPRGSSMRPRGDRPDGRGPRGRPGGGAPRLFQPDDRFEVFVASSIGADAAELNQLAKLLALAGFLAVATSALLIRALVSAGLRPLGDLSNQVAALEADRLDVELDVPGAPVELAPIVEALDSARVRLSSAFDRERRFTSDAAHELRTPLAGLRSTLEVSLRRERTSQQYRDAAKQCLEITLAMHETVATLLELARGKGDLGPPETVDLGAAVHRAFDAHSALAEERGLIVQHGSTAGVAALAQPGFLERALDNITRNALSYARRGSTIEVRVEAAGDRALVRVANECDELPADTAVRAFEPFWRADVARTDGGMDGSHVGLGLSLVKQCTESMGGSVSIETSRSEPGVDRFEVTLSLPSAAAG